MSGLQKRRRRHIENPPMPIHSFDSEYLFKSRHELINAKLKCGADHPVLFSSGGRCGEPARDGATQHTYCMTTSVELELVGDSLFHDPRLSNKMKDALLLLSSLFHDVHGVPKLVDWCFTMIE